MIAFNFNLCRYSKVRIRFSLDFSVLLKSLMDFVGDLFISLFGMGSITVDCSADAVKASQGDAASGPMGAAALGWAVQVETMNPMLIAPVPECLRP
jgi:glycyl-tRNA synthetase alpha subunit